MKIVKCRCHNFHGHILTTCFPRLSNGTQYPYIYICVWGWDFKNLMYIYICRQNINRKRENMPLAFLVYMEHYRFCIKGSLLSFHIWYLSFALIFIFFLPSFFILPGFHSIPFLFFKHRVVTSCTGSITQKKGYPLSALW